MRDNMENGFFQTYRRYLEDGGKDPLWMEEL